MSLLWTSAARYQVSDSPSGHPAWVEPRFPVSELVQYADPGHREMSQQGIDRLSEAFREKGFQPRKHRGFDYWGTKGTSDPAQPIHLVYQPNGHHFLLNGNHRAWAAEDAGLEHVPVLVTDMREKR